MTRARTKGLLTATLVLMLGLTAFFALRAVNLAKQSRAPEEPLRLWMTIPYVAHSRQVPQSILWTALGIQPHLHDHRPISRIARQQHRSGQELIRELNEAIAARRGQSP